MKRLLILFLLIFESSVYASNYCPVEVGNTWEFEGNKGNMSVKITDFKDGYFTAEESFLLITVKGIFNVDKNNSAFIKNVNIDAFFFIHNHFTLEPEGPVILQPLYVGKKWKKTFKGFTSKDSFNISTIEAMVLGEEVITVPAGTFKCLILATKRTCDDGASETLLQWLAPNVGSVKIEMIAEEKGPLSLIMMLFSLNRTSFKLKRYLVK